MVRPARSAPLVIAHRGASGYLPEHTLAAKALAFGMGADYLEQDVVATADDRLVVLHDLYLDRVTDVAKCFPSRHRDDGRYYVRDFELDELRTLNVHERRRADGAPVFPGRFPTGLGRFRIATLEEEIEMTRGLADSTGRVAGLYPEIKAPAWHRQEGVDLSALILEALAAQGFGRRRDPVYLQCFDAGELRRVREELKSDLKLVQLIESDGSGVAETDFAFLKTAEGLRRTAEYADGIGPSLGDLYALVEIDGQPVSTGIVTAAHSAGLEVHPYTFRADALPAGFGRYADLVAWFAEILAVDGLFTDFPDLTVKALQRRATR